MERDFKNAHKDVIVDYTIEELDEIRLWGRHVRFVPENPEELARMVADVVRFVEEHVAGGKAERFYDAVISDCREPELINCFYGIEGAGKFCIPASRYAVFRYKDKGGMGSTFRTVTNDLFKCVTISDLQLKGTGIDFFELYEEDFDQTGAFSIWVPVV